MKQVIFASMKKIILLLIFNVGIVALNTSYGLAAHYPINPARSSLALSFRAGDLVKLSPKQFSELTGKKMNVYERLSFKAIKLKMKHDLKKNPNLTLQDYYRHVGKKGHGTGWLILIVVVFILLLIVLFAAGSVRIS